MSVSIQAIRGDTFALRCARVDAAGNPFSVTNATIRSDVANQSARISLSVVKSVSETGVFDLRLPAESIANFTVGLWLCDVEFVQNGTIQSTERFSIIVEQDVTNAA
jgi:hypothetical protein